MNTESQCVRCGARLPAGYEANRPCPRCLMEFALAEDDTGGEHVHTSSGEREDPPPSPEDLAADFPNLEIVELLGEGGMGVVFRARQRDLDREVALKILRPRFSAEGDFAERFMREARALARLSHPGIVSVHDFGKAGSHLYLLMELVEGTNLRRLIHNGLLAPAQALDVVSQVSSALQFAHDLGIVHRDIKPENILVDRQGRVKIADFGLAKMAGSLGGVEASRLTRTRQAMGTPQYMAPEQIEHPLEVDHRADIYSLGVVFYELLTGELPIGRFAPPSRKIEVDVRLDQVVLKSLEKEPERRYQHASEIRTGIEDIERTSNHGRHGMPQDRRRESPEPRRPRHQRGAGFWIPIIVLLLGGCVFLPLTCAGAAFLFLAPAALVGHESGPDDPPPPDPIVAPAEAEPGDLSSEGLPVEGVDRSYEERALREAVDSVLEESPPDPGREPPVEEPSPPEDPQGH